MANKRFWSDFVKRTTVKAADKLLIGNSDTGETQFCEVGDAMVGHASGDLVGNFPNPKVAQITVGPIRIYNIQRADGEWSGCMAFVAPMMPLGALLVYCMIVGNEANAGAAIFSPALMTSEENVETDIFNYLVDHGSEGRYL